MHIFDGAKLYVEKIANLAVTVGVVADSVELQIGVTHTGYERLLAEFLALGEFDAIGCGLD